jgi:type IV pilus assembly protein PilN
MPQQCVCKSEIKRLEGQIKDIASLESEIAALRARQQAVEDLQADRNVPVHLLTELVKQLPDGVYISSMRQDRQTVTLQGVAQSNERVSELLRNLSNPGRPGSPSRNWWRSSRGPWRLRHVTSRRVSNFTIAMRAARLKRLGPVTFRSRGATGHAGAGSASQEISRAADMATKPSR